MRHRNLVAAAAAVFALLAAGIAAAFAPGERVLARWPGDDFWYPARVLSATGGAVQVAFDDGDVSAVSAEHVRDVDWRAGTRLQCNWRNEGTYYGGVVASMDGETILFLYDDGDRETMTIGRCRSA